MSPAKICPACAKEYSPDDRFCPVDGAVLRSPERSGDLVGQVIADRYHVVRKLGEGGMGQVYLAEHLRMGRQSAVKVMSPALTRDPDSISRFNREASNASRISHPNVAAIYDFGETADGLIYLAMEFVEGESLTALLERQGPLPPARALAIVRQTADALSAAHDMGIVHRDLKPDNIMVARTREGADLVKVVDFGIAKAVGAEAQRVTRTGLVVGTPEYMSPEQLAGDTVDERSDVYSLGLVAFTALTGALPFPSETAQESMIMRLTEQPRSLAEIRPEIRWPTELQGVMDRALARDARARFATAAEMGRALEQAMLALPGVALSGARTQPLAGMVVPPTRVAVAPRATWRAPALAAAIFAIAVAVGLVVMRGDDGMARNAAPVADSAAADASLAIAETSERAVHPTEARSPSPVPDESGAGAGGPVPEGRKGVGNAGAPAPAPREGRAAIEEARKVVEENLQAARVDRPALLSAVAALTRALPALTTFADSVDARYLRAQGLGLTGATDRSCRELRDLIALGPAPRLRTEIETLHATACQ